MANWVDHIRTAFDANRVDARTFTTPGGARLLLLDHGARVLGCELPGVDGNLFWHNPALEDAHQVGPVLEAAGGEIGGDRLWIAPEVGYMWPDLEAARTDPVTTYRLPPQMDPAEWGAIEEGTDRVVYGTTMSLTDHRHERPIVLNFSREIALIDRPAGLPDTLACASFAIRNDLSLIEGERDAVAGTWDLLQVPITGTIICPTVMPVEGEPRRYYAPFGPHHVQVDERCVRFLVDGVPRIKMGLSPEQTTGRMGYFRELGDGRASLIVRIFLPQPGEAYIDLPRDSDETFGGDALQAYNDDGNAVPGTSFGELEYHDPAVVVGAGPSLRTGTSVTHVLAGPSDAVHQAGRSLLGVEMRPIRPPST